MFELVKDLFVFGYKAADRMEEKAEYFAEKRRERMEQFRKERQEMHAKMREIVEEHEDRITKHIREDVAKVAEEFGFATKNEVDELKKMISKLDRKLDKVLKT